MKPEQRHSELLAGLKATGAEEVTVNITHLMEAGMKAEAIDKMSTFSTETMEVTGTKTERSTRKDTHVRSGLVGMPRLDLIEALEACKPKTEVKKSETPKP